MSHRVVIVGGGLAGLAAAAALAERGQPSVVLESRPRLGGRASSFFDTVHQEWIDNCQHVAMGCCTNFLHFCRLTGIEAAFQRQPALYFVGPDARVNRFAASAALPAPLHLLPAFAGLSYLTWSDKWALARGLKHLAQPLPLNAEQQCFADWLVQQRQPVRAVRYFWQVVLVSALSETLEHISTLAARKVFVDGFLSHRDAWSVHIPVVPLEQLYGEQLSQWLSARGVEVRLLTAAEQVELEYGHCRAVLLKSGESVPAEAVILAAPWHRLAALFPPGVAEHPRLRALADLQCAPISSLHLWFDRPVMPLPHAVFVEGLCQWVFNRSVLQSERPGDSWYYQVVISASRELAGRHQDDIRRQVLDELAAVWPAARTAVLLHSRQVTEHRAVFSVRPGSEELRPRQQSPVGNVYLAGDWTQTGWPATMEGAVRSGYLAAECVLRQLGQPAELLQSDLPVALLSRSGLGL